MFFFSSLNLFLNSSSVDYANDSLFVVNGPDLRKRDVAGYIFDMNSGEVSGKFGTFLDPHDIAVTPDAREVKTCFFFYFFFFEL